MTNHKLLNNWLLQSYIRWLTMANRILVGLMNVVRKGSNVRPTCQELALAHKVQLDRIKMSIIHTVYVGVLWSKWNYTKNLDPYDFLTRIHQRAQMSVIFDRDNCISSVHLHLQVTSLMRTTCTVIGLCAMTDNRHNTQNESVITVRIVCFIYSLAISYCNPLKWT